MTAYLTTLVVFGLTLTPFVSCTSFGEASVAYEWSAVDIDWSSQAEGEAFVNNGSFVPQRNLIGGLKVYQGQVYVAVPRWRSLTGIPVTLAKVVLGSGRLQPFPDWRWQTVADCRRLQYVQSMEIDPNTGLMYVIDTGRIGLGSPDVTPADLCPAKIVVFDLNSSEHIASYELTSASRDSNFINDIVLDYVGGEVRYAYITDVGDASLHVFDFQTKNSWRLMDDSMKPEPGAGEIPINGGSYQFPVPIDGIAMSPDFEFVYFCPLGGFEMYQVPTSSLRQGTTTGLRSVGRKQSQSDGMIFSAGSKLFFGALADNAVFYWDAGKDVADQKSGSSVVTMASQISLSRDDRTMQWPDGLAIDEDGYLWFISNRLHLFMSGGLDFSSGETNIRVWKVFVDDNSYLHLARERSAVTPLKEEL